MYFTLLYSDITVKIYAFREKNESWLDFNALTKPVEIINECKFVVHFVSKYLGNGYIED